MKKKAFFMGLVIIIIFISAMLFSQGNSLLKENVEVVTVERGSFQTVYKTAAAVSGTRHALYFNGIITACDHQPGDRLKKDEVILSYLDERGERQQLRSPCTGYLTEAGNGLVVMHEDDYHLIAYLKDEITSRIKRGSQGVFEKEGRLWLVQVEGISEFGRPAGNDIVFEVTFDTQENTDWKINQKGNLKVILERFDDVLTVDKRALLEDDKGFYLLDESWINSFQDPEKCRREVDLLMTNDSLAMIQGVGIENCQVCILTDELRGLLNDQAD